MSVGNNLGFPQPMGSGQQTDDAMRAAAGAMVNSIILQGDGGSGSPLEGGHDSVFVQNYSIASLPPPAEMPVAMMVAAAEQQVRNEAAAAAAAAAVNDLDRLEGEEDGGGDDRHTRRSSTTDDDSGAAKRGGKDSEDNKDKKKKRKHRATPLPMRQITILILVMMTESIGAYVLLPFVGLYVAFLQGWPVDKAGYLAGFVVGSYMLGQVVSSKFWGYLSDQYGRRVPLVFGLFICAAMMFAFGLGTNLPMICIVRFIQGFFNGTVLIAKTVVAEITDSTNVAKGFAAVSMAWGVGTVLGAAIGGFLYDPVMHMGADPEGFFSEYPAFVPCLICAVYMWFTWIMTVFFLRETNAYRRPLIEILPEPLLRRLEGRFAAVRRQREIGRERAQQLAAANAAAEAAAVAAAEAAMQAALAARHAALEDNAGDENIHINHNNNSSSSLSGGRGSGKEGEEMHAAGAAMAASGSSGSFRTPVKMSATDATRRPAAATGTTGTGSDSDGVPVTVQGLFTGSEVAPRKLTYIDALRVPKSRYLLFMMGLWCAADMAYSECLPLWAIAEKKVGGLEVYSDMVSVLMLAMGAPSILANLAFSWTCSKFPDKTRLYRVSVMVWVVLTMIIPVGGVIAGMGGYWYTFAIGIPRQAALSFVYGVCWLLVPRVAPPRHIGEMNGIVNSVAALMRCIVPFAAAPLFAWSISSTNHYFPYNHFLIFIVASALAAVTFVFSLFMGLPKDPPMGKANDDGEGEEAAEAGEEEEEEGSGDAPVSVRVVGNDYGDGCGKAGKFGVSACTDEAAEEEAPAAGKAATAAAAASTPPAAESREEVLGCGGVVEDEEPIAGKEEEV